MGSNMIDLTNEMAYCHYSEKELISVDVSKCGIENMEVIEALIQRKPKKLYLQENLIDRIEFMNDLTTLVELNLSSNSIFFIENLDCLYNLSKLDLSNNCISKIENLEAMMHLKTLYLNDNNITKIEGLDHLTELESLNLSRNEIRIMCNLGKLRKLTWLNLSGNLISTIPNLEQMDDLRELDLSENLLDQIPILASKWGNLQTLHLSKNSIRNMNLLTCCNMRNLIDLDLSSNCIQNLDNIQGCTSLRLLLLTNNLITDWRELRKLKSLTNLRRIYLKDNPYLKCDHEQFMYPLRIGRVLPNIITIDGIQVEDDNKSHLLTF